MTNFIGSSEIPAIENYDLSLNGSQEEVEIPTNSEKILVDGEKESIALDLDGVLVEGIDVQDNSLEEQREDIKNLVSEDVENNPFEVFSTKGFLSVESVDVPESSESQNLRNVSISGRFYPWPKNYSNIDFDQRRKDRFPNVPAFFDVNITSTNSPIIEGQTLEVDVEVRNSGLEDDTQNIEFFDIDSNTVDSTSTDLKYLSSKNLTFNWNTEEGDFGEGNIVVSSDDDSDSAFVKIEELVDLFNIVSVSTNSSIKETEDLNVEADIKNDGTESGTQNVLLKDFSNNQVDSKSIALESGDSTLVTLIWSTEDGDSSTGQITVETDNDSVSKEVTIEELLEAFFDVTIDDTNSPIKETETLKVDFTVENTGEKSSTQTIELLDFDGNIVDSESIQLNGSQSLQSKLEWTTDYGDEGTKNITVRSDDVNETKEVTVEIGF